TSRVDAVMVPPSSRRARAPGPPPRGSARARPRPIRGAARLWRVRRPARRGARPGRRRRRRRWPRSSWPGSPRLLLGERLAGLAGFVEAGVAIAGLARLGVLVGRGLRGALRLRRGARGGLLLELGLAQAERRAEVGVGLVRPGHLGEVGDEPRE